MLIGCGLHRGELLALHIDAIQLRGIGKLYAVDRG
jgi:hypothetical protein